jgi:hypothetical protein
MIIGFHANMKTPQSQSLVVSSIGACLGLVGVAILFTGCAEHQPYAAQKPVERYHYRLMSPGTEFAELPPAVQRTIRAETGGAQIANIEKGSNTDLTVYKVLFVNAAQFPPLYVAQDGSLLNPDLTVAIPAPHELAASKTVGPIKRVTVQDLPPEVVKAIQAAAPDAEVSTIVRETERDKVVYVVTFKDQKHPALFVAPDGTLLGETSR